MERAACRCPPLTSLSPIDVGLVVIEVAERTQLVHVVTRLFDLVSRHDTIKRNLGSQAAARHDSGNVPYVPFRSSPDARARIGSAWFEERSAFCRSIVKWQRDDASETRQNVDQTLKTWRQLRPPASIVDQRIFITSWNFSLKWCNGQAHAGGGDQSIADVPEVPRE